MRNKSDIVVGSRIFVDLSILYEATALALTVPRPDVNDLKVEKNPRVAALLNGLAQSDGPLPLSKDGRRTLSGMDLFHRVIAMSNYYCATADKTIHQANADYLSHLLPQSKLAEVCVGHGDKTASLLNSHRRENWPDQIYINDIVGDNLTAAAGNLKKAGYPANRIARKKGNILDEKFWDEFSKKMKGCPSERNVLMMQGATFNDFSMDEMEHLLRQFQKLPPSSIFLISIDNTVDENALRSAYDHYALKQLALTGIEHKYHGARFSAANTECRIDIVQDGTSAEIQIIVEDKKDNKLYSFNPIRKMPREDFKELFKRAGVGIVRHMTYTDAVKKLGQHDMFPDTDYGIYALRSLRSGLTTYWPGLRPSKATQ